MNTDQTRLTIHYPEDFDERAAWEANNKGWLAGVVVELDDGSLYPLFFYDPVRLRQDLECEAGQGRPYLAEPGLIILPEVTPEAINRAVHDLARDGYFTHLQSLAHARQEVA